MLLASGIWAFWATDIYVVAHLMLDCMLVFACQHINVLVVCR